jgi:hypothetical protein
MIDDLATQRATHFDINSQVTANTLILMSPIGMAMNKLNHRALSSTIYNFAKSVAGVVREKEGNLPMTFLCIFRHIILLFFFNSK